ncbi:SGNH/GDSL hydrolase family protein [Armatimonas rosea]|uniref:Lysophospholipase L1-like esterase n=1 Tax=Armatimonas rosea TaxID=685828 RepID=A0A7W9SU72_ARMRO|nr:SGNH/GDSL hydrolase family protein [Armatimonas rosea]MBB6052746.1 lysophospholipase L1-like esterase [Armatimonas rosea]
MSNHDNWVGAWMASPQLTEAGNLPPAPGFVDTTVRQIVRVTLTGRKLRVRLSNEFGSAPLTFTGVQVARALGESRIVAETNRALTFHGAPSVTVPPGTPVLSDVLDFPVAALSDLAITLHLRTNTTEITGHPGSRCTSYLQPGVALDAPELPNAAKVDHWYFLSGVEVLAEKNAAAMVTLGDSITDGRGSPTNGNGRWPDYLARRLQADKRTRNIAVLNAGIGGNCVIKGGIGPSALARFDRDVLAQPGVKWLILFEGINDLGTKSANATELIAAYEQLAARAQAHGIKVYGATILPCGSSFYFTPELERERQALNQWIRTTRTLDAFLDFDAALRDPQNPTQLSPAAESNDHLHPEKLGYKVLAESIPLGLFRSGG